MAEGMHYLKDQCYCW